MIHSLQANEILLSEWEAIKGGSAQRSAQSGFTFQRGNNSTNDCVAICPAEWRFENSKWTPFCFPPNLQLYLVHDPRSRGQGHMDLEAIEPWIRKKENISSICLTATYYIVIFHLYNFSHYII